MVAAEDLADTQTKDAIGSCMVGDVSLLHRFAKSENPLNFDLSIAAKDISVNWSQLSSKQSNAVSNVFAISNASPLPFQCSSAQSVFHCDAENDSNYILLFGAAYEKQCLIYSFDTNQWQTDQLPQYTIEPSYHCVVKDSNNIIYSFGGRYKEENKHFQKLDLNDKGWFLKY